MSDLEELIQYWKDRLASTPQHTTGRDKEAIRATIAYLERLNELWKESQLEPDKAIELLSDYCDRGVVTLDADFKEAVRMGKASLILLSHPTTYCLDGHSLELLRKAQRRESEQ